MDVLNEDAMIKEVNLTTARNLSPLFDDAVRKEQPVMIVRGRNERGLLLSRDRQLRLLDVYALHVDVIPEEEVGGFTLWVRELNLGEYGSTLLAARDQLLDSVRSYVRYYFQNWDLFRHLPDKAAQEPYVYRLNLAKDDDELIGLLFGDAKNVELSTGSAAPAVAR
jgi:hypothetical protein